MSLKDELISLKERWEEKISDERAKLESRLKEEMIADMRAVIGEQFYAGYCCDKTGRGIETTVEFFVNNWITASSIEDDPSGDWDGDVRAGDLEDYIEL